MPADFADWLEARAKKLGIEISRGRRHRATRLSKKWTTLCCWAQMPDIVEAVSPRLGHFGILAILADQPLARQVNVDVGRVHYDRWLYVGSTGTDIAAAYQRRARRVQRSNPAGTLGSSARAGRWDRCTSNARSNSPMLLSVIVCTDVSDVRLDDLCSAFADEAKAKGIEFICLNPTRQSEYQAGMARFKEQGFDDIVVLAPIPAVISDAATWLASQGIMNIFAGVGRGTMAKLNLSDDLFEIHSHLWSLGVHDCRSALDVAPSRIRRTFAESFGCGNWLAQRRARWFAGGERHRVSRAKSSSFRTSRRCRSPRCPI